MILLEDFILDGAIWVKRKSDNMIGWWVEKDNKFIELFPEKALNAEGQYEITLRPGIDSGEIMWFGDNKEQ